MARTTTHTTPEQHASHPSPEHMTIVPADWFDRLAADLDTPGDAPALARAAHRCAIASDHRRHAEHDA
jgi:hypothetical protein